MDIIDLSDAICDEDVVGDEMACPYCHENRVDYLVWDEYGLYVQCSTCANYYHPDDNRKE